MKLSATTDRASGLDVDAVVVGVAKDEPLAKAAAEIDQAIGGTITAFLETDEIDSGACQVTPILAPAGVKARQVVCVGLGKREQFDAGVAFRTAAAAARALAAKPRQQVAFCFDNFDAEHHEAGIAGALVGCTGQDLYRAEKKRQPFGRMLWAGADEKTLASGKTLGDSVNLTRRLVNEPPDVIFPEAFADRAREVAEELGLTAEVWGRDKLEAERCGSLLAVARGSAREPYMVMLHYRGAGADDPVLALVGKGVTFDSGGLSLKPSESMLTMKLDMSGAATVLGAIRAIAALELPVNVSAYMGLVENMTGPAAYKLGDVLTARSGKTIEVHNTDAEGRLVLADTLSVAVDQGAARIIDLATLTGACMVALGLEVAGLMTNNQSWCDSVVAAAKSAGEPVWQLPMFESYDEQIKSDVADIKNVGEGRWGGAITAAKLLEQFVGDVPWTHIDIAGPAFSEKPLPWLDGGATGTMVRTLVEVARNAR